MTAKALFNFWLTRWALGLASADDLADVVAAGKLTAEDSTEIQGCWSAGISSR